MNPWELVVDLLGWFFLALVVLGAIIILLAIAIGGIRSIIGWNKPSRRDGPKD